MQLIPSNPNQRPGKVQAICLVPVVVIRAGRVPVRWPVDFLRVDHAVSRPFVAVGVRVCVDGVKPLVTRVVPASLRVRPGRSIFAEENELRVYVGWGV